MIVKIVATRHADDMKRSILLDREDINKVSLQEQLIWIIQTLQQIGIPEEELGPCLPDQEAGEEETVQHRIALKELCQKWDLIMLRNVDGTADIYIKEDLVGHWAKPRWELRLDPSQKDPKKKMYAEMFINSWTIFEETK
jgi:hypothetical protein